MGYFSDDYIARVTRDLQTVHEKEHGQLDIGVVPDRDLSLLARNEFTFYAEAYGFPQTPEQRARWKAEHEHWEREQRRLINRWRRFRRFVRNRASETWDVLLHGLPECDC
jgi:hypothetical protein